jgi:hypothetical protein
MMSDLWCKSSLEWRALSLWQGALAVRELQVLDMFERRLSCLGWRASSYYRVCLIHVAIEANCTWPRRFMVETSCAVGCVSLGEELQPK